VRSQTVPFKRRFNFRKAKWKDFRESLDKEICNLDPKPDNYEKFVEKVKKISRLHIPRGCREQYISRMTEETCEINKKYGTSFTTDPFREETVMLGETLINHLCKDRNDRWHELIENTDMTKNSKKAWRLIKRLNGDPVTHTNDINVTANQVASQLLLNGKSGAKIKREKLTRIRDSEKNNFQLDFTLDKLNESLKEMKNGNAPGVNEVMTEQIKEFSIKSKQWLLTFLNS
jgi:hypothetical protein